MNDQLEQDLSAAFDRRAAAPVDTAALAAAAGRRGRRLRARAYAMRGVGVVALVAVAAVGAVAVTRPDGTPPDLGGPTGASPSSSAAPGGEESPPPGGWNVPALPVAAGVPGAAAAPQTVGADAAVLHFTVDEYPTRSQSSTWSSGNGTESVAFRSGRYYQVALSRSEAKLDALVASHNADNDVWPTPNGHSTTVAGRPAMLYDHTSGTALGVTYLRWQPIDGLYAQVYAHGNGTGPDLATVAGKLRLDTSYRCVLPARLAALPTGAKLLGCSISLTGKDLIDDRGTPTRLGVALLSVGDGTNRADFEFTRVMGGSSVDPGFTVAGHPARQFTNEMNRPSIMVPDLDGVSVQVFGNGSYTGQALIDLVASVKVAGDGRDPSTWPDHVVG